MSQQIERRSRWSPEMNRPHDLRRRFGMTVEQYDAMLEAQDGVCPGCGMTAEEHEAQYGRRLFIDHDHRCCPGRRSCGKCVRGLLCMLCNRTLGTANDNPERLRALADYVERQV